MTLKKLMSLSLILSSLLLSSCTTVKVISADKEIHWVPKGSTIVVTNDCFLVPDATMRLLLQKAFEHR